ncbi:cell division protein ZipA [Halomonas alkaliantarctica]|uniref:Cell division protein ZipA n=1 Tax=Halomonas alkaliantarctica TaxID=232346 RepID=A0ABY8LP26_9GAMM|nr:cell division protein ZipA [Halomonas alkaliantarctica]WGI26141.1 cell division protein ZipA [Halomonas alkaliantarctica]
MELREWLIILGLALVSLIVIDGARRLQRQRRVPRLDQVEKDLSGSSLDDPDEAAKAAEINWELPNGGARVVKPADYSGLGNKPKLERQEHPGPSRVLSEFRRSVSTKAAKRKSDKANKEDKAASIAKPSPSVAVKPDLEVKRAQPVTSATATSTSYASNNANAPTEHERREPSISIADSPQTETPQVRTAVPQQPEPYTEQPAYSAEMPRASATEANAETTQPAASDAISLTANETVANEAAASEKDSEMAAQPRTQQEQMPEHEPEPVLRAEPEDAVFAKHANEHSPKRRQLRSDTAGEYDELDDDEVDEYRLVDFEGMGRSLKRRLIARRKEKQRKKAEKAVRDKALAQQKAERKALEAEQRREAKEAADAERARLAQEQAQAREEEAAANAAAAEKLAAQQRAADEESRRYESAAYAAHEDGFEDSFEADAYDNAAADERGVDERVRVHPTLEKALRHDVSGEHAKETLTNAEEVVVISVLSRDPEGFDGTKLLELMMVCGLRYSSAMGVFHRFETESDDSELQFSMVNVVKPGTFPIEEMGEFMTPGITLLMPLPGAIDSAAAFEAMVETAMVVVRHMGGELKDENRSVMTAQTIEFARQRVREFERRHRLHRQLQAR